jgi:hypothetical protein
VGRRKITIPKKVLEQLYLNGYKSPTTIAKLFNCNRMTIQARIRELNIPFRSPSIARMRYRKYDFSGDLIEKAYLIGFRLGDLNVYQTSSLSELIVARCNTTNFAQIELIKSLFSKYGTVTVSTGEYSSNINCYLNKSFLFLLNSKKIVPLWIEKNEKTVIAFIAGYVDAEGTFQINQGRGRFALATCDREILWWIHMQLKRFNILGIYKKIAEKGSRSIGNYFFKEDVWRLNINELSSLLIFINILKSYLKHEKRISDMNVVLDNLEFRKEKRSIWKTKVL